MRIRKTISTGFTWLVLGTVVVTGSISPVRDPQSSYAIAQEIQTNSPNTDPANESEEETADTNLLTLKSILIRSPSREDYDNSQNCISMSAMRHYDILSARFVAIEIRRTKENLIIQFDKPCAGLQKNARLAFEMKTGSDRLCKNDSVTVLPMSGSISEMAGSCSIPGFEKVNDIQLDQLKRGVASKLVE